MTPFGTISLGELIAALKDCDHEAEVQFDFANFQPNDVDSYRGFYDHLAFSFDRNYSNSRTVEWLLGILNDANGKTFKGWKGGSYIMRDDTPIWVAQPGETTSTAVVGVQSLSWGVAVIQTKYVDV